MQLSRAVAEFVAQLQRDQKSKATVNAYRADLSWLRALAPRDTVLRFSPELIHRYFDDASAGGNKPATLHRKAATIREFVRWGAQQRLWESGPLLEAVPKIRRPENLPRPFDRDEIARLWTLDLVDEERVLRALLFFTGLRSAAIRSIIVGDISENPPTIRTVTKGNKTVLKHMHPTLAEELLGYLRRTERRGRPQDLLFRTSRGRMLTEHDLLDITHRWGVAAKVTQCLPHRFRHSFATSLVEGQVDVRVIAAALDHRDLKSTMVYTRVSDARQQEALLRLPASWSAPPTPPSEDHG